MATFDTRLRSVVGDRTAKALATAFGMETVEDLLRHYPRRYIDVARPEGLDQVRAGQVVTMLLQVADVKVHKFHRDPKKFRTEVVFTDGPHRISAIFFNQRWVEHRVKVGSLQLVTGTVGSYNGTPQLSHPMMQETPEGQTIADMRGDRLAIPVYPGTQKVSTWQIEDIVGIVLDSVDEFPEPLPESVRLDHGLPSAAEAFELIHRPHRVADAVRAQDRFRFEEAFVLQTVFALRRQVFDQTTARARPRTAGGLRERFEERLPFTLTAGQRAVIDEITADLDQPHPMHRLLQGEVGSGKTIVALLAMLQVVDSGAQAALLAPTEVLATQHHRAITTLLGDLAAGGMLGGADGATRVALLTGSMSAKARQAALLDVQSGAAGIVIGTHALLQDTVNFAELGLLVVDEQHRFGVEQRAALVDRSSVAPHVLVMTATPIPRTVAMTVFGDLETSTLRELPGGRQPIQTTVVPTNEHPGWVDRAWQRILEEVATGRQAYVVASRIGDPADAPPARDSEEAGTTGLVDLVDHLRSGPLASVRVAMLHGRMPAEDKDRVMTAFAAREVDVLVATTVIEVGVDVPNATVMVVMDADRFGLSQLHQLRGRVGRGSAPGLCLLVSAAEPDSLARERLAAVAATGDGFELARLDVELRREGDVLGARQSGVRSSLRLLSVVRDEDVIARARDDAWCTVSDGLMTPALHAAVTELEDTQRADFLERT